MTILQLLHDLSKQVADVVGKIEGTSDVFNGIVIAGPSVSIEPDYARLAQFGLTPAALQYQIQASLEGNIVGTLPEKEQMTNIRMVYPAAAALARRGYLQDAGLPAWRTTETHYRSGNGDDQSRRCRDPTRKPAIHGRYHRLRLEGRGSWAVLSKIFSSR